MNEVNIQMHKNLQIAKENTEMLDSIERKGEMLEQESQNFRQMAAALKKKTMFS